MQVDWSIPVHQPYALHAMQALSCTVQDRDKNLFPCLLAGVPTGCSDAIPPSSCFIPTPVDDGNEDDAWVLCDDTWKGARDDPDPLESLVEEELRQDGLRSYRRWRWLRRGGVGAWL